MRWPFGRRTADEPAPVSPAPAPPVGDQVHASPGLRAVVGHLEPEARCNVLDLGPAMAATVGFFSRYRCRIRIADLAAVIGADPGVQKQVETDPAAVFAHQLSGPERTFDLVLAWDVFDRLEREQAAALVRRLKLMSRPGARLFALFNTGGLQPGGPLAFAILDEQTLLYRPLAGPSTGRQPFNPASFERLLEGFRTDVSVVLRHGIQEWVAVRLDDPEVR